MAHDRRPDGFEAFDARLRRARGEPPDGGSGQGSARAGGPSGHGAALQAGIEIIAGVAGGALLGYALDRWLGTAPWLLILLFLLGGAGGMRNALRRLRRMGGGAGNGTRDGRP